MHRSSQKTIDSVYPLLGAFLSPQKTTQQIASLKQIIEQEEIPWGPMLLQANLDLCTSLWYVCLRRDGLLAEIPQDLNSYLEVVYSANLERNQLFRNELEAFLEFCQNRDIEIVLLKGAATFCDDPYNDPGARMMKDLDLLAKPSRIPEIVEYFQSSGYTEIFEHNREFEQRATDIRHHHINAFKRDDSPVVFEIHYHSMYASLAKALPAEQIWAKAKPCQRLGRPCLLPDPDSRMAHNALHATVTQREFIQGQIPLLGLAEQAYLALLYPDASAWNGLAGQAYIARYSTELKCFEQLTQLLLQQTDHGPDHAIMSNKNVSRCLTVSTHYLTMQTEALDLWDKIRWYGYRLDYLRRLPAWMWQHTCYAEGLTSLPDRIRLCLKKLYTRETYRKI